jgi:Polyketide cyclase / dehydrase and lipid transport
VRLQSEIVVERTNEQVWRFFSDPANLARWDRSVARVVVTSREPFGVGSTFDTIAPARKSSRQEGLRMSYRFTEYVPNRQVKILLTDSPMFTHAEWIITTDPVSEGVRITCQLEYRLRHTYSFLLPVLLLTYRAAFRRDLTYLKQAIESD